MEEPIDNFKLLLPVLSKATDSRFLLTVSPFLFFCVSLCLLHKHMTKTCFSTPLSKYNNLYLALKYRTLFSIFRLLKSHLFLQNFSVQCFIMQVVLHLMITTVSIALHFSYCNTIETGKIFHLKFSCRQYVLYYVTLDSLDCITMCNMHSTM